MSDAAWRTASDGTLWVCWGLVAVVWLVGAGYNAWKGPRVRSRSASSYLWIVLVVVAWLVIRHLLPVWRGWATVDAAWARVVGLVMVIIMTVFALWARGVLGTMWSSSVVVKNDHILRTEGPYAIVRHPIYTGFLGMLLGTAFIGGLGPWLVLFAVALALFEVKIHFEEQLMGQTFGEDYQRYRSRVPQPVRLRLGPPSGVAELGSEVGDHCLGAKTDRMCRFWHPNSDLSRLDDSHRTVPRT